MRKSDDFNEQLGAFRDFGLILPSPAVPGEWETMGKEIPPYHEDGVDALDFTGVGRQWLVPHVPHQTRETLDGQNAQVPVQPEQALLDGNGRVLDEVHLFLPGPLGAVLLALALLVLLLVLQRLDHFEGPADRPVCRLQHLESVGRNTRFLSAIR